MNKKTIRHKKYTDRQTSRQTYGSTAELQKLHRAACETDRHTDRHTDKQRHRHSRPGVFQRNSTDQHVIQTERQTDTQIQTYIHTDSQTDKEVLDLVYFKGDKQVTE